MYFDTSVFLLCLLLFFVRISLRNMKGRFQMGLLQLGPLNIKYEWIILFGAGLITYLVLLKVIQDKSFRQELFDTHFNIIFIWILIFKLSILLFRPSIIIENPLGLLYFHGGTNGIILASIVSLLYLYWKTKKLSWSKEQIIQGLTYTVVSFIISYWLFRTLAILIID